MHEKPTLIEYASFFWINILFNLQNSNNAGYSTLEDADAKASLSISYVKLPTSSCDDRISKFKKLNKNNDRLQKIIGESHGIKREKPKLTERYTINLEVWMKLDFTILHQLEFSKKVESLIQKFLHQLLKRG